MNSPTNKTFYKCSTELFFVKNKKISKKKTYVDTKLKGELIHLFWKLPDSSL